MFVVLPVVSQELDPEHVSVVHEDVAGGDVDYQLVVPVVLVLVHQQEHLVLGVTLVHDRLGVWWHHDPVLPTPLLVPAYPRNILLVGY